MAILAIVPAMPIRRGLGDQFNEAFSEEMHGLLILARVRGGVQSAHARIILPAAVRIRLAEGLLSLREDGRHRGQFVQTLPK